MTATHHPADPALSLLSFLNDSPSPWHAVANMTQMLEAAGFAPLPETQRWPQLHAGGCYYVTRGGSALIAFRLGEQPLQEAGLCLIGAHTDSPGLRLKPKPGEDASGIARLGVEVYGGPILATFSDRDLSLAGRVMIQTQSGLEARLLKIDRPLLRLPNLAIHMNRDVNESGLRFNKQQELPLTLAVSDPTQPCQQAFTRVLAEALSVPETDILSWELNVWDTQPPSFWGKDEAFIASRQLDNLASCHAGLMALLAHCDSARKTPGQRTAICAFFDHEEVGSESPVGAAGSFLDDVLQRICQQVALNEEEAILMRRKSFFISADMAHAWHPNYPNAYEPNHRCMVNAGPVIKSHANLRYATQADSAARFMRYCQQAGVPFQQYAHRSDLGCGSTIGPMLATRLGMESVDVGNPMWSMHSIRESAGRHDHAWMIAALHQALTHP